MRRRFAIKASTRHELGRDMVKVLIRYLTRQMEWYQDRLDSFERVIGMYERWISELEKVDGKSYNPPVDPDYDDDEYFPVLEKHMDHAVDKFFSIDKELNHAFIECDLPIYADEIDSCIYTIVDGLNQ